MEANYLLHKLARLAKTRQWDLDAMLKRWECFEICCALEKTENLKHQVYLWSDLNPDIKDKIGLPESDVGIDYIDAELSFAGQAKLYKIKSYVSAKHIDRTRFCAYRGSRYAQDANILPIVEISTPENVKLGKCKVDMEDIVHNIINETRMRYWYEAALKLPITVQQKMDITNEPKLRPCQENALKCILPKRCNKIRAACGMGKTRVALEVIRRELGRYLVLVPSIILADQWASYLKHSDCNVVVIGTGFTPKQGWCDMEPLPQSIVVVCVYNSYQDAFYNEDVLNEYKYVIVDEAHHIYDKYSGRNGEIWKIVQKYESSVLLSASLPIPEDEDTEGEESDLDFNYSLRDAINDGVCVDYNMIVSFFEKKPTMKAIAKYIKNNPQYVSILVYCNSITAARTGAQRCTEMNITANAISCEESKKERREIIQAFEGGKTRVLWSVATLGEGVNLSCADTVIFAEPRRSAVSIQQCVGRAVRLHSSKQIAHVVVCTHMDNQDDVRNHPVVNILRALSEDDPLFVAKANKKSGCGTARILYENVKKIGVDEKDCEWIKDDVFRQMVKNSKRGNWMINFHIVKEIYGKTGRLPKGKEYMNIWLRTQRNDANGNRMRGQRIELLDSTFGDWLVTQMSGELWWLKNFNKLKNFYKYQNRLPNTHEGSIGHWLNIQRRNYYKDKLNIKKVELMNNTFSGWLETRYSNELWMRIFNELNLYCETHQHFPSRNIPKIGIWFDNQKGSIRRGTCNKERLNLLNKLLDKYSPKNDDNESLTNCKQIRDYRWNKIFLQLKTYCETIGHLPTQSVPVIGRWLSNQNRYIKNGKILSNRLKLLTELLDKYQQKSKITK